MDSHKDSAQVCRLEVVDTGRRRRWSFEEKLRIVEESFQGHRQASATARRHGISSSLLFGWRRAFREGCLGGAEIPDLVPAVVLPDSGPSSEPATDGRMSLMEVLTVAPIGPQVSQRTVSFETPTADKVEVETRLASVKLKPNTI